jgi:hypothetical protein
MSKRLAIVLFAFATGVSSAARGEQKDMLVVILEDDTAQKSAHYQMSPHESCSYFLSEFRKSKDLGSPITLWTSSRRNAR